MPKAPAHRRSRHPPTTKESAGSARARYARKRRASPRGESAAFAAERKTARVERPGRLDASGSRKGGCGELPGVLPAARAWQQDPDLCQLSESRPAGPGPFEGSFRGYTPWCPAAGRVSRVFLLPKPRFVIALLCALAALTAPAAAFGSATMFMGAAEDEGRNADPQVAMAKMQLAKAAGFDTIRVTANWSTGLSAVPQGQLQALQSIAAAGVFLDIRIVATVMPIGSSVTPLTATARTQFARFAADLVRKVPTIREYIVGNEPNLNRYWLPQFGPQGEDVAASSYVQLLARSYDLMKAADPNIFIDGGSVSPRGIDRPGTGRDTHSPTAFITDMGTAYRALKRKKPIMDGFSFHPYGESSSTPPTVEHNVGTSLGLADYPRLVDLLGKAFDH